MDVGKRRHFSVDDPIVVSAINALSDDLERRAVLIAGPPGFGKTSVLEAAVEGASHRAGGTVVWISGGIVASEGHLASLLSAVLGDADTGSSIELICRRLASTPMRRILLSIDDIDALVFKRENVAKALVSIISAGPAVRLIATCHPAASERLSSPTHPLVRALRGRIETIALTPFDDQAARDLIHRRAPRLSPRTASVIIAEAGGYPAALVFLGRLAELIEYAGGACSAEWIDSAAEFAGAVYAEPWASLGPQQRAILWRLSSNGAPTTAADIAQAISLPASHVSAQLTRLIADGLIWRTQERGHYSVAPLLARWIARRVTRDTKFLSDIGDPLAAAEDSKQSLDTKKDWVTVEGSR
jgi:hypothetical protein